MNLSPASIKDYIDRKFCAMTGLVLRKVTEMIGESAGGSSDSDTSAPAMTKAALATATGVTGNSVYLTDGTGALRYAWRNTTDTTSAASSTIIVDGDNVRWYILSMRDVLDGLLTNYSPFP